MYVREVFFLCSVFFLSACTLDAHILRPSSESSTDLVRLKIVQDETATFATTPFDDRVRFKIISSEELDASTLNPSIFKQNGTAKGLVYSLSPSTGTSKEFTLDVVVSSTPGSIEIEIPEESITFLDQIKNDPVLSPSVNKTTAVTQTKMGMGFDHTCYIDSSKTVRCLGHASEGQMGDGGSTDRDRSVLVPVDSSLISGSVSFQKVIASDYGSCALNNDGAIYCWGDNYGGEAGIGSTGSLLIPTPVLVTNMTGEKKFRDISSYYQTTCGITEDDRLFCWGKLPLVGASVLEPQLIDLSSLGASVKVAQVGVGFRNICALSQEGRVFCFGNNWAGQLGNNSTTGSATPVWIDDSSLPPGTIFKQVSVGDSHNCALSFSSEIYCWGYNSDGQLGDGTQTDRLVPTLVDRSLVPSAEVFAKVVVGRNLSCGISRDGAAYCFGHNGSYTVGNGAEERAVSPTPVDMSAFSAGTKLKNITMHQYRTCAETTTNQVVCWGWDNNYSSAFRETDPLKPVEPTMSLLSSGTWKSFVSTPTSGYACGISNDDTAYCWGDASRRLGTGNDLELTPAPVDTSLMTGTKKFSQVAVSTSATCGVATDGILYCWGSTLALGLGATTMANIPTPVLTSNMTGATTFSQVSVGGSHACGVATDGKGYCWGQTENWVGIVIPVLGNGTYADKDKPYPVSTAGIAGSTLFSKIITTTFHSCGLMTDGKVYCWGSTAWGSGFGAANRTAVPLPLDTSAMIGATTFTDIHGSYETLCGTSTDGVAYCWGDNYYGLVGTGDTVSSGGKAIPVNVSGVPSPLAVSSMRSFKSFSCGLLRSNSIYCWGHSLPSLSESSGTVRTTPVLLDPGSGRNGNIVSISGGYNSVYALTDTGHLYCWGLDCSMALPRTKPTLQSYPNH